ncbi:hypothetical protein [Methylocaldum szegediense]|jgi:hypothetical protein|nr:hypothetical protein [Methylocaldum szegediense]
MQLKRITPELFVAKSIEAKNFSSLVNHLHGISDNVVALQLGGYVGLCRFAGLMGIIGRRRQAEHCK